MGTLAEHGIFTEEGMVKELGVTKETLRRWQEEHDFPARSAGKTTFYDVQAIREWIARKPAT